jgi:hypothetical protein
MLFFAVLESDFFPLSVIYSVKIAFDFSLSQYQSEKQNARQTDLQSYFYKP